MSTKRNDGETNSSTKTGPLSEGREGGHDVESFFNVIFWSDARS